jgi:glycosyltransferase involved in cell wall biosynthesis
MEKVSVIMGAYRPDPVMLKKAVESILAQTYGNLEFLICDDGSNDGTWDILQRLAANDGRVRLLRHQDNRGLAAALNTCIAQAEGAFVARQDADDISHPARLQKQLDYLREHPDLAYAGCNLNYYDSGGVWGARRYPAYPQKRDFLFSMPFMHGSMVFRREALESSGGYLSSRRTRLTEDYELLMRMYAQGLCGGNVQQNLYTYLEDEAARNRRTYRFRVDDAVIRAKGFYRLGLLPKGLPYVMKPLVVGLLPRTALARLKGRYYNLRQGFESGETPIGSR